MQKKYDKKAYKYFVYNPKTKKILSGWEYKSDAQDHIKDLDISSLKVYTRTYLTRIGVKPSLKKNWGSDRLSGVYSQQEEKFLYGFRKDIQIPEIKVRYNKGKTFGKVRSSSDVAEFLKKVYGRTIEIQEQIIVLYLNRQNEILGYYRHSVGTPVSAIADIPMMLGIALKSMARSIILSHNHPSGNREPSQADKKLTKDFDNAAQAQGLQLLDHIILTKRNSYYSFADRGLMGVTELGKIDKSNTIIALRKEIFSLLKGITKNSKNTPRIAEIIKSQEGYDEIEAKIIKMLIHDGITASACIPHIESEL